jgi:hypothetical protein
MQAARRRFPKLYEEATSKDAVDVNLAPLPFGGEEIDTAPLEAWLQSPTNGLTRPRIHGFLCKSKSPTCGSGDARMYSYDGNHSDKSVSSSSTSKDYLPLPQDATSWLELSRSADGAFTGRLRDAFPDCPVASERDLCSPEALVSFLRRCDTADLH